MFYGLIYFLTQHGNMADFCGTLYTPEIAWKIISKTIQINTLFSIGKLAVFILGRRITGIPHFRKKSSKLSYTVRDKSLTLNCVCINLQNTYFLLAHLSTTCSRGAFRITLCPACVVRRASSTISLNINPS